ncbi:Zn2/Cys6 DNA-binding protein [Glarea lozoyensis ATCC 20868]|uniref:Zn2/Cys6 DNA-binding protein n=1 Tax=Glarea lozoyensis (strain ATCC 20868 / MF5171) TaxID=1116229 RepID=S3DPZ5_GLAL2|nr:Zn2/Cys6 DNA-binding protein [Glarea lozoyensis ATCC 20868]EPE28553.1 Zn2/Cys6 DNA-binding protein [Glarea lozoyensis ATCC 20868]
MTSSSRSTSRPKGRNPQSAVRRSGITRVRTGCQTCRGRKKKCDESKPHCLNCTKANLECSGLPEVRRWENTAAGQRALRRKANTQSHRTTRRSETLVEFPVNLPWSNQPSPLIQQQHDGHINEGLPGDLTFNMFPTVNDWDVWQNTGLPNYQSTTFRTGASLVPSQPFEADSSTQLFLAYELPSLIPGIETELHRRLFHHFTKNMTPVLTSSSEWLKSVVPLAQVDRTVMSALLSLAASHLSNFFRTEDDSQIKIEKDALHLESIQIQEDRLKKLRSDALALTSPLPVQITEINFLTCLLLVLYELCEGSNSSLIPLARAREVLLLSGTPTIPSDLGSRQDVIVAVNPFLLEFFDYHESLATVTLPYSHISKFRFQNTFYDSEQTPFMMDFSDGFNDFACRISSLREQVILDTPVPHVICAVELAADIRKWMPKRATSREAEVLDMYKRALFIWLFSIIYTSPSNDIEIQKLVATTVADMAKIEENDPALNCILFPLFIIGGAATTPNDRASILREFQRLKDWSRFGNIDQSLQVVQKIWSDRDLGLPDAWDWVRQLEAHNKSLLVT